MHRLGSLSSKYEVSNRGSSTVSTGIGDAGGVSYGAYQMTSKPNGGTVLRFVNQLPSPYREKFVNLIPGTTQFTAKWIIVATNNPNDFPKLEHAFIKKTHYDPLVLKIKTETGIDVDTKSLALQNVIWSVAVQHGGGSSIVQTAIRNLTNRFDENLIKCIYKERARVKSDGNLVYFSRNSKAVQKGVANRFLNEEKDALGMLIE